MGPPRIEVLLDPQGALVGHARKLARKLALQTAPNIDPDDLVADALVRAWRDWPRFDASKAVASTFVFASLRYGIVDALRVARRASRTVVDRLSAGGDGTGPEGAKKSLTAIDVRAALALSRPTSLTPPPGTDASLWCAVPLVHAGFADVDNKDKIMRLFARAFPGYGRGPVKERMIFMLYYFEDLTMREIGAVLGLSESRVCQLHTRGLERLREVCAG